LSLTTSYPYHKNKKYDKNKSLILYQPRNIDIDNKLEDNKEYNKEYNKEK
jgi:hypothetical protein